MYCKGKGRYCHGTAEAKAEAKAKKAKAEEKVRPGDIFSIFGLHVLVSCSTVEKAGFSRWRKRALAG